MDFEDDQSILEHVFALIDSASEFGSECCRSDTSDSSSHSDAEEVNRPSSIRQQRTAATKKKRIRRPETSSTAFQRKRKAEVLALREESEALEAKLRDAKQQREQLRPTLLDGVTQEHTRYDWCEQALEQYHLRLRAERLNLSLRASLDDQVRVNGEILANLRKRFLTLGTSCNAREKSPATSDLTSINHHLTEILQLELRAERLNQERLDICKQHNTMPTPLEHIV